MRRKITRIGLFLFVLALVSVEAFAQGRGKISGTVTDADTGDPLPGVNVIIDGTTLGAVTDVDGDYFIANLETGTYDLRASFVGYRAVLVEGVAVSNDRTTDIDFELAEETMVGEEVVVIAQRPLVETDNTTSVVRLESQEVTSRPTTELTDVLNSLPSINEDGGNLTVRGGALDEVAFMVDGARARNPLNHNPYTRINLSAIAELEVITGSFNAEYGEAQSGVINVVTKEGADDYEFFLDARYEPAGLNHWGTSLYDRSSDLYWENANARHQEWWIEYPDMWVDPNGVRGSDPRSVWTPEEAYQNYLDTHQPLTDYTDIPSYQTEIGIGGPVPFLNDFYFFGTIKRRSEAPLLGNAYRDLGLFTDGTLKLTYRMGGGKKLSLSGFIGSKQAGWGYESDDDFGIGGYPFWAEAYGVDSRYAYYDQPGYPTSSTNGQTLQFSHVLNASTLYELKLVRVQALREVGTFPADSIGFSASDAVRDHLRAVDASGNPIPGGNANRIGFNTSGYLYQYDDDNTEWQFEGYLSSQVNKFLHVKTGLDFSYYRLDHFNHTKYPTPGATDERVYKPYQGAVYSQGKVELGGLIMNAGLRFDFYNANDTIYTENDLFDPLGGEKPTTNLYAQLSPRLGISHPIDANTVLHFSYGHFFQRPSFNDYGEQIESAFGSLNTLITDDGLPVALGNRNLRPQKTIAYEVGIERNFWDFFLIDLTGYYKDYRNTIRTIQIQGPDVTYVTTANGDYADYRGVEFSLRKIPSTFSWGSMWGYANYTMAYSISGSSGDPVAFTIDGVRYGTSGDNVGYHQPRVKAGIFYETPGDWGGLMGSVFGNLSVSLDYRAVFPNDQIRSDIFVFEGESHVRPVDQLVDLRARKDIELMGGRFNISPYIEIENLMNDQWVNLFVIERASLEDRRAFVESDFEDLPDVDANGEPILDIAKFRNLPRSVTFGITARF